MEGQRLWQRGSSNSRRGLSGSRQQPSISDPEADPMMSTVQKSLIASIVQGARASLQEPSRPYTPGDLGRHLFQTDEYSNRPGSSYKMKSVVGQANEEFIRDVTSASTTATFNTIGRKIKIQQNKDKLPEILQKVDMYKKKVPQKLPQIIKPNNIIPKGQIKVMLNSTGPVKPIAETADLSVNGSQIKQSEAQQPIKIKKEPPHKQEQKQEYKQEQKQEVKDDYNYLLEESKRSEEQMRFVQQETENLIKLQNLQSQIKQANRQRENDYEGELEDEYEDYFANEMIKDLEGVESYEQGIDYYSSLKNIQDKVLETDQTEQAYNDDIEDNAYLMENIEEQESSKTPYELEYNDVISEMSKVCLQLSQNNNKSEVKEKKVKIDEESVLELCPRIWSLSELYGRQNKKVQETCFIETILKGSFSLLAVKYPKVVIRLSACIINLFFKIFDKVDQVSIAHKKMDLQKQFNYLCETMKALLIYAKEGQHDLIFKEENLIPLLGRVIGECFIEKSHLIIKAFTQVVNKKEIANDDKMYELVNYTIGSIKCFTQSNNIVQKEAVNQNYIQLMQKTIAQALSFGSNMNKRSMMLVQMTGTLRNLVNDEESYKQINQFGVIPQLCSILGHFQGHKELMLNISRILSKLSLDHSCSLEILKTNQVQNFIDQMQKFQDFSPFVIRIAFVLGNLTTYYQDAREQVCKANGIEKVLDILIFYFNKDVNSGEQEPIKDVKKKELNSLGNIEDSMTKLVRLLANIATEEDNSQQKLHQMKKKVEEFILKSIQAIARRTLEQNEEFILNVISCMTNILFYDTSKYPLLVSETRIKIFNTVKGYILATKNEEIQIESVRVLSNLSRHTDLCEEYVSDKHFLEALIIVLDHTLRDLVFYSVGIIINITLHPESRPKVLDKQVIPKLIDVFKDSNIEDMDLSKVTAKALHNMVHDNNYWTVEIIKKLDDVLTNLGEELDSIMDVANEEEQMELKGLRDLVNALINDMPEPMFECNDKECGRKFKNKEELEKHIERRHPKRINS